MAENKKSFLLYADLYHTVDKLPDNKAGKLLKHILRYVNDLNPVSDDIIVQIAFEPIKQQLKRDLVKYEEKKKLWSEAGKKSAESKKNKRSTESTDVEVRSTESTVSVTDTVTVNVTDTIIQQHHQHTHEVFGSKLFTEAMSLDKENIELQLNPKRIITPADVEGFNRHLKTEGKHHVHVSEYHKHLRNWMNKKPDFSKEKSNQTHERSNGKNQPGKTIGRISESTATKYLNRRGNTGHQQAD